MTTHAGTRLRGLGHRPGGRHGGLLCGGRGRLHRWSAGGRRDNLRRHDRGRRERNDVILDPGDLIGRYTHPTAPFHLEDGELVPLLDRLGDDRLAVDEVDHLVGKTRGESDEQRQRRERKTPGESHGWYSQSAHPNLDYPGSQVLSSRTADK